MLGLMRRNGGSPLTFPWVFRGALGSVRREFDEAPGSVWPEGGYGWPMEFEAPLADISETNAAVEVRMDLPGVKPEELQVELNGEVLTVSGERKSEKEEQEKTFHLIERHRGTFTRSLRLPAEVKPEKVEATFRDGVLLLTMPKAEVAKVRKIEVKG